MSPLFFATQSLADIENSSIAPALIESCPSRIFLPNDRAIEPQSRQIYKRFGLNDRQIELISRSMPKRDYYYQSQRGNRLFELGLGPLTLALCGAGSSKDQKDIDAWIKDHPNNREERLFANDWFNAKGLNWAAELLPGFDFKDLPESETPTHDPDDFITEHLDRLAGFNDQIHDITAMLSGDPSQPLKPNMNEPQIPEVTPEIRHTNKENNDEI